jgi:Reverse transcriptase (RNA-dependent DNA polymerase)
LEVIFCVQGAISPLLANLFLHYAFDMWMAREFPHIPFERYADDAICHCRTEAEACALRRALASRMADCKLMLHPEKTKIVYCKDANRRGDFPDIRFDFLGFQFRARKTMWTAKGKRIFTHRLLACGQSESTCAHRAGNPQLGATSPQRQIPERAGCDV